MQIPWHEVLGIGVCLIFSGFFSASETALSTLGETDTQKLIDKKSSGSDSLKLWLDKPLEVLTTILIWNNLVNITASALATELAENLFEESGIAIAIGVMTFLILTFGEIAPKSLAKGHYKKIVIPIMRILIFPHYLTWPLSKVFSKVTISFVEWSGGNPSPRPVVTEEQIEYLVDLGSRVGSFDEERERLLQTVFDLSETTAKEVMVPRTELIVVSKEISFDELIKLLVSCGHTRIPVFDGEIDNIVGIFHSKDILHHLKDGEPGNFELEKYVKSAFFIPETKHLEELFSEFKTSKTHMAVVVDEFGGTSGIVTLEDILEEFFGEIQDEYDNELPTIEEISPGFLEVSGRASLEDIGRKLGVEFPDDNDYESIAGFVMDKLGMVPKPDDTFVWENLNISVLESDLRRVIKVRIELE